MDPVIIGFIGIIASISGLLIGLPIAAVMGLVSVGGMAAIGGWKTSFGMIAITSFKEATSYDFAAVVLYMTVGTIAHESGMADYLFDALTKWFGRLRGGLMMATTIAAAFFGACSGSSIASCALFGKLAVPKMLDRGYNPALATGCVAAAGTLAVLIPPSGMLILYGILTQQSIGHLFIAGLLPGIINTVLYLFIISGTSFLRRDLVPEPVKFSWSEKWASTGKAWPPPLIGLFIIVSLYTGIATPTEIAGLGAFFSLITALLYRGVRGARIWESMIETARQGAMILLIVIAAKMFGRFLALSQITPWIVDWVNGLSMSRGSILFLLIIIYVIAACIIDALSLAVVSIPIVYPLILSLGYDPIWFGVILTELVEIAVLTPPVGMNVFVTKTVVGDLVSLQDVFKGTLVFAIANFVLLTLMIFFPEIVLFLPRRM